MVALKKPCKLWPGRLTRSGYGKLRMGAKDWTAHRLSWWLVHGDIPEGLCVCHHCDTPACVEPTHLFLGTTQDNRDDAVRKDRHARGERCGQAKLTDQDILDIRAAIAAGETGVSIAKRYGLVDATISNIRNGHTWKHIKGEA